MRLFLAIVSFVISALFLGYLAVATYYMYTDGFFFDLDFAEPETRFVATIFGGILFVGLVFLVAGVAMLATKVSRK